jgi:hypothetical protein
MKNPPTDGLKYFSPFQWRNERDGIHGIEPCTMSAEQNSAPDAEFSARNP